MIAYSIHIQKNICLSSFFVLKKKKKNVFHIHAYMGLITNLQSPLKKTKCFSYSCIFGFNNKFVKSIKT